MEASLASSTWRAPADGIVRRGLSRAGRISLARRPDGLPHPVRPTCLCVPLRQRRADTCPREPWDAMAPHFCPRALPTQRELCIGGAPRKRSATVAESGLCRVYGGRACSITPPCIRKEIVRHGTPSTEQAAALCARQPRTLRRALAAYCSGHDPTRDAPK